MLPPLPVELYFEIRIKVQNFPKIGNIYFYVSIWAMDYWSIFSDFQDIFPILMLTLFQLLFIIKILYFIINIY